VAILTDKNLRRFQIVVGVAYDEDVDQSRTIIEEAVKGLDVIRQDKPVEVYAQEFNSSSIDFVVRWWAESKPIDKFKSTDKVIAAIKKALDDNGIEIPFPYRTLTFKEPLTLARQSDQEQSGQEENETPKA
jgi:small-conductance mechanosensitive channel